jgi:hypothetical protein
MTERPPADPARRTGRPHRGGRPSAGLATVAALLVALVAGLVVPAGAATSDDAPTAADAGAAWLEAQLTGGGGAYIPNPDGTPNVGQTLQIALALAATASGEASFEKIVDWFEAAIAADGPSGGGDVAVGPTGNLLLVLDAAGRDPRSFGGHDLVAVLEGTLGLHTPGLYGAQDPAFDGVYRQSVVLLGLASAGATPAPEAIDWLVDQQCDATTPQAQGGWEAFRADTSVPCTVPDASFFSGADTNQTALALQALAVVGVAPDFDGLAFLDAAQLADGGFPYLPGGTADVNSTALVIQALVATGEDPQAGRWAEAGGTPVSSLLSWQLGCDSPDAGAFASPWSDGFPDGFATQQAVWGASLRSFPLGEVTFTAAADPCATTPPTTPTTAPGSSVDTTATTGPVALTAATAATAATPVAATPRYTG